MIVDPKISVAFTGHRSYHGERDARLVAAIRRLYDDGFRNFLSGMAVGFDLAAAEAVLSLRRELAGIRLFCIVPFDGHAARFAPEDKDRFMRIYGAADSRITLAPAWERTVYMRRNDFLVENSSAIVAYFAGTAGGTEYTLMKAVREGHRIKNIYLDPQQSFDFGE